MQLASVTESWHLVVTLSQPLVRAYLILSGEGYTSSATDLLKAATDLSDLMVEEIEQVLSSVNFAHNCRITISTEGDEPAHSKFEEIL